MYRTIVETSQKNLIVMDVFSKLVQERIIFIDGDIDNDLSNGIIAQMLYLDSLNHDPINIYIKTCGGDIYDGLAIYDTALLLGSPIHTYALGIVASMGIPLMLMGSNRVSTKHTRFMIHQPIGGVQGQVSDIEITAREIQKLKKELYTIIANGSGNTYERIEKDSDRDYWMTAEEAKEYGIITNIL